MFYYLKGREELVPFLGGLIGYFGSDFAEGKALVFLQNKLEGGKVINHVKAKLKREAGKPERISLSKNQTGDLQVDFMREF